MNLIPAGFLDRMGKAEGIVIANLFIFSAYSAMRCLDAITGPEWGAAFAVHISLFMGGSTLAAFRDWKKNGSAAPGTP